MNPQRSPNGLADLKAQCLNAFDRWLDVPDSLIAIASAESPIVRHEIVYLLNRSWFKLKQDMSSILHLVDVNHFGTAKAVLRMCRETALNMLVWSLSDPAMDRDHLHLLRDVRPKENAKRLKRDVEAILGRHGQTLDERVVKNLEGALAYADAELSRPPLVNGVVDTGVRQKGFTQLAGILTEQLLHDGTHHAIPGQVVDFWLESETVHSGFNSIHFYALDEGEDPVIGPLVIGLAILKDLYPIKAMVTMALMHAMGLEAKLQKPKVDHELGDVVKQVERVLQSEGLHPEQCGSLPNCASEPINGD